MPFIRNKHKTGHFTKINDKCLWDKRLPAQAKGLLMYSLSRPDNWQFTLTEWINASPIGEKAIRTILQELETLGYLVRYQQGFKWVYDWYEVPNCSAKSKRSVVKRIFRQRIKQDTFTLIDNACLRDNRLSFHARGLLGYCATRDDDWAFTAAELINSCHNGEKAVEAILRELESLGYLDRIRQNLHGGRFGWSYHFHEIPNSSETIGQETIDRETIGRETIDQETIGQESSTNKINKPIKLKNNKIKKEGNYHVGQPKNAVQTVLDYLNQIVGGSYCPTAFNSNLIKARFNEGFTVDNLKLIIDFKALQWGQNTRMKQYLRPSTLFAPKADEYLNTAKFYKEDPDEEIINTASFIQSGKSGNVPRNKVDAYLQKALAEARGFDGNTYNATVR